MHRYSPLLTDLYELTMLSGYLEEGMADTPAVFDIFFRQNPFQGGYAVFAGLEPALEYLEQLAFTEEEVAYVGSLGLFREPFLDFLRQFRFRGRVTAPPEGTVVFANEPLLTVEGTLAEAQFVETALLNIVNFQTLVATKAARITHAAHDGTVLEFGLRRAQGPDGGLSVARAACVGGVMSTSNVLAGKEFGLPVRGTHAHSWIMAFSDELTAFRKYAEVFPDSTILLVDTYDTLTSGLPNAITVARELRERGHELVGIRIDSGDLAYLSREARRMLDEAGFPAARIVASNELDEYVIDSIRDDGGRVDIYGVGTKLAACMGEGGGALGGVYKLVRVGDRPRLKVTSDIAKATLPDRKRLLRAVAPDGSFIQDVITLEGESVRPGDAVFDPVNPLQHKEIPRFARLIDIRSVVMEGGRRTASTQEPLQAMAERSAGELRRLPAGTLRFINPHRYKVSMSSGLSELRLRLMQEASRRAPASPPERSGGPPAVDAASALVIVDVQNDFCPGGALGVPGGDEIIPAINRAIAWFGARGLPIFASRDWHPEVTSHFRAYGGVWPPHCIQGTRGAEFHPSLQLPPDARVISKGMQPDSDDYSAFHARDAEGAPLAVLLSDLGVNHVVVCGLATDYCVKETAIEARRGGLTVTVLTDAVRGVDISPGDSERALATVTAAGAKTATTDDLLQ